MISAQLQPAIREMEKNIFVKLDTERSALNEYVKAAAEESSAQVLAHLDKRAQHLEPPNTSQPGLETGLSQRRFHTKLQNEHGNVEAIFISDILSGTCGRLQHLGMTLECETGCACACHTSPSHGKWNLKAFAATLGCLSVTYQGITLKDQSCNDHRCHGRQRWIKIDYYLPGWLMGVAISAFVSTGPPTPEALLRVIRQVDVTNEEMYVCRKAYLFYWIPYVVMMPYWALRLPKSGITRMSRHC